MLEALCELFPDAPIYTLLHDKGSTSPTIESREIVTSFLNKVPGIHQNYRKFLPLMPLAAQTLKIKHEADIVISNSHCVIKGVRKPKGSWHLSYVHSPMRYVYDQFDNYFGNAPFPIKLAAHCLRPYLQWWDKRSNSNVDKMFGNSAFIQSRIQTNYGIESGVLHPFVDLQDFAEVQANPPKKEDFYLMVTAFAPNKRVDLAIDAFRKNGLPLKIIGGGSQEEETNLKRSAASNIEFLGKLPRGQVIEHYAKAKAFIFPGVEDFGITPLEALAAGTPVIAYRAGGVLETLTEETATFFDTPSSEALNEAIRNSRPKDVKNLYARAKLFSKKRFSEELLKALQR